MMSLQLKTLIVQVFKAITELLGKGGIHWTGGEVGERNSTNPLAKYQISDCVGSKSASGSFLGNIRDLLSQAELGKDVSGWVTCPGMKEGLELLLSLKQNVGGKEMLENSLPSSMSLTSRQLDVTRAIPCLQILSGSCKTSFMESPRSRALSVVPFVDSLDVAPLYQILGLIWARRPRLLPLDIPMAGALSKDHLSAPLVKTLVDETSGISGLSVLKTGGTPGDGDPPAQDSIIRAGEKTGKHLCVLGCNRQHNFDSIFFCRKFRSLPLEEGRNAAYASMEEARHAV